MEMYLHAISTHPGRASLSAPPPYLNMDSATCGLARKLTSWLFESSKEQGGREQAQSKTHIKCRNDKKK